MKQFTFTIFVPVYNGEKTLDRVFKSIKSQTYKNFEVIIINDGSTDNSDFIIRQFINEGREINTPISTKNKTEANIPFGIKR